MCPRSENRVKSNLSGLDGCPALLVGAPLSWHVVSRCVSSRCVRRVPNAESACVVWLRLSAALLQLGREVTRAVPAINI